MCAFVLSCVCYSIGSRQHISFVVAQLVKQILWRVITLMSLLWGTIPHQKAYISNNRTSSLLSVHISVKLIMIHSYWLSVHFFVRLCVDSTSCCNNLLHCINICNNLLHLYLLCFIIITCQC